MGKRARATALTALLGLPFATAAVHAAQPLFSIVVHFEGPHGSSSTTFWNGDCPRRKSAPRWPSADARTQRVRWSGTTAIPSLSDGQAIGDAPLRDESCTATHRRSGETRRPRPARRRTQDPWSSRQERNPCLVELVERLSVTRLGKPYAHRPPSHWVRPCAHRGPERDRARTCRLTSA